MDVNEINTNATTEEERVLQLKSSHVYRKSYDTFMSWRSKNKISSFSEDILLSYFKSLKFKPSSLWAEYSKLKSTLSVYNKTDISKYRNLLDWLKKKNDGFEAKKAKTFTQEELDRFITEAPDLNFLQIKVAVIFGIMGACGRQELQKLESQDVIDTQNTLIVKIMKAKKLDRTFAISGEYYDVCKKYMSLRPKCDNLRFFIRYSKGRCVNQNIGLNKFGGMGKVVAKVLKLPNPELYTGHCFRRTSVTLFDDGDSLLKMRGWQTAVAEQCDETNRRTTRSPKIEDNNSLASEKLGARIQQSQLRLQEESFPLQQVALILGIKGSCRAMELTNITTKNMEFQGDIVIFKLSDKKNKTERSFVLRDEFLEIFKKYFALRPENTLTDRLFLNYRDGKCTRQVIGRHKILSMPKQIANFLNLPNSHLYTGHCFRRTSKTLEDENNLLVRSHGGTTDKVTDCMDDPNDTHITINILKSENDTAKSHGELSSQQQRPSLYTKQLVGGSRDPPDFIEQHTPPKFEIEMMTLPGPPAGPSRIIYVKTIDSNAAITNPFDPLKRRSQRCRFCFQFSEECIPISPNYLAADKTTLAFNNVQVELDFADNFPNVVCKECDVKLQIMYDFVKDVKAAQVSLVKVEVEMESRREDTEIEMVTVKTEYEDDEENDSPDKDDNDKPYDNPDEDDNEDNDTKEGIIDSLAVGETNFTKQIIPQKRITTTSAENPKKAKVAEYENTEFVMDIKEEVIERNDTTDANNAGLTDPGTPGIDVSPCIEEFTKSFSVHVHTMRSDGNS